MQLSVLPHLLIYGDVSPDQLNRGPIRNSLRRIGQARMNYLTSINKELSTKIANESSLMVEMSN
jgi:hypothetical protein